MPWLMKCAMRSVRAAAAENDQSSYRSAGDIVQVGTKIKDLCYSIIISISLLSAPYLQSGGACQA